MESRRLIITIQISDLFKWDREIWINYVPKNEYNQWNCELTNQKPKQILIDQSEARKIFLILNQPITGNVKFQSINGKGKRAIFENF